VFENEGVVGVGSFVIDGMICATGAGIGEVDVGVAVVGERVGGEEDGGSVGVSVGLLEGSEDGPSVGSSVGSAVGGTPATVGSGVGSGDGAGTGIKLGEADIGEVVVVVTRIGACDGKANFKNGESSNMLPPPSTPSPPSPPSPSPSPSNIGGRNANLSPPTSSSHESEPYPKKNAPNFSCDVNSFHALPSTGLAMPRSHNADVYPNSSKDVF